MKVNEISGKMPPIKINKKCPWIKYKKTCRFIAYVTAMIEN